MRILMVHNEYARPSGEEQAAAGIAALLEARGHSIHWFRKSSADLDGSIGGRVSAFFSGIHSRSSRKSIERLLDAESFDLVQVQNLYPQISPSILKPIRDRGIPLVMRCPNYRIFCPNGLHLSRGEICERCVGGREWWCVLRNCEANYAKSLGYAVRNAAARRSGAILDNVSVFIVLSEFQKSKFIRNGIPPERIAVVPNFDPDFPSIAPDDTPGDTISFVGRLSPEKGIALFLDAARHLPHLPFAVAGDTSRMPGLPHSSPPNVSFRGFLSGDALDAFYRRTRIFVCPSLWFEGFPNVVTRAMAHAKPVIASRIGALPEIVADNETGLLFEPGNAHILAGHIQRLAADDSLCQALGRAGRLKVERDYSPSAACQRLCAAYDLALFPSSP